MLCAAPSNTVLNVGSQDTHLHVICIDYDGLVCVSYNVEGTVCR
jgi:hypothetical protein